MRFRPDEDLGAPLDLESTDGAPADGVDVDFGGPNRTRPRPLAVGAVAALAVIGGAWLLGRSDSDSSEPSPPSTIAPIDREAAPTAVPAVPPGIPSTTSGPPPAGAGFPSLGGFASDPGYGVYVRGDLDAGTVARLDLVSGALVPLDVGDRAIYGVVPVAGDSALLGWAFGGFAAPLADGTSWYFDGDDLVYHSLLAPGVELERLDFTPAGNIGFGGLNGVTAAGRPTVLRADGRTYEVAADGTLRRLADGVVASVDQGRYAEQTCAPDGSCSTVLHGGAIERYDLGVVAELDTVSFSPDGRYAMLLSVQSGGWRLVDLTGAGQIIEVAAPGRAERMNYGPTSASIGWSPDSRNFFFMADGLAVLDPVDRTVERVFDEPDVDLSIVGVA